MAKSDLTSPTLRTLRLDDSGVEAMLDHISEESTEQTGESKQYEYRRKALVVQIQQPGDGAARRYMVATRCLSASEISFLHGGFIHPGSKCCVQLVSPHGTWKDVSGVIVNCRFIKQNIHEVTVCFDEKIDVLEYCHAAMHSRVLLVDDDPFMLRLAAFHLEHLNCEVDAVADGATAVEKALACSYDLVFMDMEMPVIDGFEATRQLRKQGYSGLIVAATGLTRPEDRKRCLEAGCNKYLPKPYAREDLATILESLNEEPLLSTLSGDSELKDLVNLFVAELPAKIRAVEEAFVQRDNPQMEAIARSIKGEAGSFGFEPIMQAAETVESAIRDGQAINQAQEAVNGLIKLCLRARGSVT